MIQDNRKTRNYNESEAFKMYMKEINEIVLDKNKNSSLADTYRNKNGADFDSLDKNVSGVC